MPNRADTAEWIIDPVSASALLFVLSMIAGSADTIGFLGLDGLFVAHITGNLVILAARLAIGGPAPVAQVFSVPVFVGVLALVRLLAAGLERARVSPLLPLLTLQFVLLSTFLVVCVAAGPFIDPTAPNMVVAGMLGVSAMAAQNAAVQMSLSGMPSSAVMTTNVTRFVLDVGSMLFGSNGDDKARAGERARRTGLVIAGFALGCAFGAIGEANFGLRSLLVPTAFAFIALVLGAGAGLKQAGPAAAL